MAVGKNEVLIGGTLSKKTWSNSKKAHVPLILAQNGQQTVQDLMSIYLREHHLKQWRMMSKMSMGCQ